MRAVDPDIIVRHLTGDDPKQAAKARASIGHEPGITFEDASLAARAMTWTEAGMDFADALHLAAAADRDGFVTFDKRFARTAAGRGGVPVTIA